MHINSDKDKYTCNWVADSLKKEIEEELEKNRDVFLKVFKHDLKKPVNISNHFFASRKVIKILKKSKFGEVDKAIVDILSKNIRDNFNDFQEFKYPELYKQLSQEMIEELFRKNPNDPYLFEKICEGSSPEIIEDAISEVTSCSVLLNGYWFLLHNPYATPELIQRFSQAGVKIDSFMESTLLNDRTNHLSNHHISPQAIEALLDLKVDMTLRSANGLSLLLAACQNPAVDSKLIEKLTETEAFDYPQIQTAFIFACRHNPSLIEVLIKNGADPALSDRRGVFPLQILVLNPKTSINALELLVKNGADTSALDHEGSTILHLACSNPASAPSDLERIFKLFPNPAEVIDARNNKGSTPLHIAARANLNLVDILLENKADRTLVDGDGNSFLDLLFKNPNLSSEDIKKFKIDVNKTDEREQTYLHRACIENPRIIPQLLRAGAEINALDDQGNSPLYYLCRGRHVEIQNVEHLISEGAVVNVKNNSGRTALFAACEKNPELIAPLIKLGADPAILDVEGSSPLHFLCASSSSTISAVKFLLDSGLSPNQKNDRGESPFLLGCINNPELIRFLVQHHANVDIEDNEGNTPLHHVASQESSLKRNSVWAIADLISEGADVNHLNKLGQNPMHRLNFTAGVRLLVDVGCDFHRVDVTGKNALHYACSGNPAMIAVLLGRAINANQRDNNGNTPLHFACSNPSVPPEEIYRLLDSGTNFLDKNGDGITPLQLALEYNPAGVGPMIDFGYNINAIDALGQTDLHRSCIEYPDIIPALLTNGADISIFDNNGETPLHLAAKNPTITANNKKEIPIEVAARYNPSALKAFAEAGVTVNHQNSEGETVLHRACLFHPELIQTWLNHGVDINRG